MGDTLHNRYCGASWGGGGGGEYVRSMKALCHLM